MPGMHEVIQTGPTAWRGSEQRVGDTCRGLRSLDFTHCAGPALMMEGSHLEPLPLLPPNLFEAQFLAALLEVNRLRVATETSHLRAGGFGGLSESMNLVGGSSGGFPPRGSDPRLSRSESVQTSCSSSSSSSSSLSPSSPSNPPKGAGASSKGERYKTELCRPFEDYGACKYGDKCQFAHGAHELRSLSRHPKYKTDKCRTFYTTGFCPYGQRCHFIHALKADTTGPGGEDWEGGQQDDYQIWARSTRLQQQGSDCAAAATQQSYSQQRELYHGLNAEPIGCAAQGTDDVTVTSSLFYEERQFDQLLAMLSMLKAAPPQTPAWEMQAARPASLAPVAAGGSWSVEGGSTTVSSPTKSSVWSSSPAPSPTEGLLSSDLIGRGAVGGVAMTSWWGEQYSTNGFAA